MLYTNVVSHSNINELPVQNMFETYADDVYGSKIVRFYIIQVRMKRRFVSFNTVEVLSRGFVESEY